MPSAKDIQAMNEAEAPRAAAAPGRPAGPGAPATRRRLYLALPAAALLPPLLLAACLAAGLALPQSLAAALAAAALAAALLLADIRAGLIAPVRKSAALAKTFAASGGKLAAPLPGEGWGESRELASSLNRLLLELSAFRGFHLNQVLEQRAQISAVIESIMDGVLLVDETGKLVYSNSLAGRLLAAGPLPQGQPLLPALSGADFTPALSKLLSSGEPLAKEEIRLAGDGEASQVPRIYALISRQLQLASFKSPWRIVVIRDITAEREIESARETIFQMITHDMRAPLTSIRGYAELLRSSVPRSEARDRCLQPILRSVERLNGMILDILNTIKLESGELVLNKNETHPVALCARVFEIHEPVAARKKLSFSVLPANGAGVIAADEPLLERVLINLVGNALKFTQPGGHIRIGFLEKDGGVEFCVEDDGPGVPEDKRKEIFDKHTQLPEHKNMGFGLGLAMCRLAVELHGGRIWVEPAGPRGSRFKFYIPGGG